MQFEQPELSANIGILWSEYTRRDNAEEAQRAGAVYAFEDAWGRSKSWLKGQYAYLAPSTLSAALNRFNLKHDFIGDEGLADSLSDISLLFLPSAHSLTPAAIDAIERWLERDDAFLCVTGPTNLPPALLGLENLELAQTAGYTAWQWRSDSPFGDRAKMGSRGTFQATKASPPAWLKRRLTSPYLPICWRSAVTSQGRTPPPCDVSAPASCRRRKAYLSPTRFLSTWGASGKLI